MTKISFLNRTNVFQSPVDHVQNIHEAVNVIKWYSSYCAGDDFSVALDDVFMTAHELKELLK